MSGKVPHDLIEVLNQAVNGKIKEYIVKIEDNDMKGENFLGEIIYVSLSNKETEETQFFVIKKAAEFTKHIECYSEIYTSEVRFYNKIWPILHKFQEGYFIGFDKLPKYYSSVIDDDKIGGKIVLEDVRQKQFRLHDKTIPLDEQHYRLLFKNYGIFHAISFAYRKRYPDQFDNLTKGLNGLERMITLGERYKFQMSALLESIIGLLDQKKDEGVRKALKKEVENNNFMKHFLRKKGTTEDIMVLSHGDCWSNNFMFKYNENNEVVDMRILDFQMVCQNSPVMDLSYLLYSGASKEILDNLDDYLKIYLQSFTDTLIKLECNLDTPFTLEKLKEEWRKHCMFGFLCALYIWRVKFMPKNDIRDIDTEAKTGFRVFPVAHDKKEDHNRAVLGLVEHMWKNKFL